jgi:hypothetical protein
LYAYLGVGVRALGMGGAFVAVADDIQACYWNPAGLGNIKDRELIITRAMNNRAIDKEWIAGGIKLKEGGIVGSYQHNIYWALEEEEATGRRYAFDNECLSLSMGGYGTGIFKNTAFGISIRWESFSLLTGTMTGLYPKQGGPDFEPKGYNADCVEYDFGILHHFNKYFTFGLMIKNYQEDIIDFGENAPIQKYQYYRKITPAIAWRPDDKTIFAVDCYNIRLGDIYTTNLREYFGGQSGVRIGFERRCTDNIAIRAGLFGKWVHTAGLGVKGELKRFLPNVKYELDYALLESYGGTHFLSCKMRF